MSLGPWEIVIILLVIILIFGGKKIPGLARSLGKGLKEFKRGFKDSEERKEDSSDLNEK